MPVSQHPLHRSVRAELPRTAPALCGDDQTLVWVRVADAQSGKPKAPELDQSRLPWMQRRPEGLQPFGHSHLETLGVVAELEPRDPIIGIPHHDDLASHIFAGPARSPLLHPPVERVVQVDGGRQRRDGSNARGVHRPPSAR